MATPVPPGFERIVTGRTTLILRSAYKDRLLSLASDGIDGMVRAAGSSMREYRGRAATFSMPIPGGGDERIVVRRALRGGLVRFLLGDLHLGSGRPFRELAVSETARAAGVVSPAVLVAAVTRILPGVYRGWIGTAEVPDSEDLLSWLLSGSSAFRGERLRRKRLLVRGTAELIGAMHRAGLDHADLHLKNILLQDDGKTAPTLHLIDLDKSRIRPRLSMAARMKNLERLDRYIEKWARRGAPVTARDRIRFLRRYFEESREAMREGMAVLLRRRWTRGLHRIGWRLLGRRA